MSFLLCPWAWISIFCSTNMITGTDNNTCTWFGEVCSCCSSSLLPQLACNIIATTYKYKFRAQYTTCTQPGTSNCDLKSMIPRRLSKIIRKLSCRGSPSGLKVCFQGLAREVGRVKIQTGTRLSCSVGAQDYAGIEACLHQLGIRRKSQPERRWG